MKILRNTDILIAAFLLFFAVFIPAIDVHAEKLSLSQAVDIAVKNSPDIDIANLEKQRSDYRFKSKAADMYPRISNFTRYSSDEYASDSANKGWLVSEQFVQPIWKGGRLYYTKEFYRNLKDIASVRAAIKELDIVFEVKKAYYDAMKYSELLKVSEEIEKVVSSHYENVDKMYRQGLVPKVDVLKTKSILDKAQLEHVQILNEYFLSKNRLNYALNVPLDNDYEIEYPAYNLDVSLTMEEATNMCLARNPAMTEQTLKEKNAGAEAKIARSELFPEVDAYGKIGNKFDSSDAGTEKSVGVMVNFDIWDWGKSYNEMKASELGYQQVKKEYDITVNRLTLGVRNAYTDYDISLKRIAAAKRFFNSISEEFSKQLSRFNNGQATNQDVLDAEALYAKAGFELMESYASSGLKKGALERAIGVKDISEVSSRPSGFENDMEFLSYIENRAFLYFACEQNKKTGLFRDTSGGGDSSIASTGFGLAALCIGVENGWMQAEEARSRALKCLKTLDALENRRDGFFYHFLQIDTGKRAGTSEISTVDTAILLYGVIAVSEYFGGEVGELGYKLVNSVVWRNMIDEDGRIFMGWTPEDKMMKAKWNYYTDEILLMSVLALGTDEKAPENVFYGFAKQRKSYKDSEKFIVSWTGSLFTYQYANIWIDFRNVSDKDGVNWYDNSRKAAKAQIAYCADNAGKYSSLKNGAWGISSSETEDGYTMAMGAIPCGEVKPEFDGTVSICGSVGSMVFTPFDSMRAARHYYSRPELWGRYGLKNAFNDDKRWISNTSFGIDTGLMLLSLENFRSGLIWKLINRSPVIQKGFKRAGLEVNEANIVPAACPEATPALSDTGAEFSRIEGLLLKDDLDSARSYFAVSDKAYAEIAGKISLMDNGKLTPRDRVDNLFMLMVISLRKPGYLSFDKVKKDYLSAIKSDLSLGDVKKALLEHVVYMSESGYGEAADSLITGLVSNEKQGDLYREAGEYALAKGKPGTAFPFFSRYLAALYGAEGPDKCSDESLKLEEELRSRGYPYYSGRLEAVRLKIAIESAEDQSAVINSIKERAASLYRQGLILEAIELYELVYSAGRDTRSLLMIGDIYLESGKCELALRKYQEYPEADENPEILFKMALCNRKMGENSAAYSLFKRIELGFKDSDYYDDTLYYMGTLNKEAGLFEESERYFEKLRAEKPGSEYVVTE